MPISHASVEGTNLVAVAVDGDLRSDDLVALREHLTRVAAEHGTVRLLVEYGKLGAMPPKSILEDLKNMQLVGKIDRAALVTGAGWVSGLASTMSHLLPFEMRTFGVEEHGAALEWVTA